MLGKLNKKKKTQQQQQKWQHKEAKQVTDVETERTSLNNLNMHDGAAHAFMATLMTGVDAFRNTLSSSNDKWTKRKKTSYDLVDGSV